MANIKISELTALTPPAAADELAVVDVSANSTKKTTVGEVVGIINGDVEVASNGTATISELPVSKLQDGAARQLLQTDAAGTGVEWTSNVDVPGTLDVTGAATFDAAVTIAGDLTVNGTTTNINTQNLVVEDKNIILADVASPTDVTADGGGITLKGATDKTITWSDTTDSWTFNQPTITTGTSTAASFIPTGSTAPSNGLYLPSSNNVAISTNGTGRLFVDSSGNVGIGATSPAYALHVVSAVDYQGYFRNSATSTGALIGGISGAGIVTSDSSATPLVFARGGTEAARIDTSLRLLVGTSSDSGGALLQVNGDRVRIATAKTPASASDTGTTGEICWDANYIYVCTATNTWKRSAISTW